MDEFERPPSRTPTPFSYTPPATTAPKSVVVLARTDRMAALVQVVNSGGENGMHSHPHQDGFWFVLRGRVRFYGDDDALLGEYGPHQGILIPRGSRYWFESSSNEPLEILQVDSFDIALNDVRSIMRDRINVAEQTSATSAAQVELINGRV